MAQDEGRFGRISRARRCWAPPHIRPRVPAQVVRESMYVFAVVAPLKGLMTSLVLPSANTAMMNLFLKHVSETFSDYFLVMQLDQAVWHHSKTLVVPENIRLLFQPAYSPEVNPVEHFWEELREKYLHNQVFPTLEALVERLCQGLNELEAQPERLHSMMFFPHFRIET